MHVRVCLLTASSLAYLFLAAGCGSPPKPVQNKLPQTDDAPAVDDTPTPAKTGAIAKGEGIVRTDAYIVEGERAFTEFIARRVLDSPLWQKYFAERAVAPNAKGPFVRFGVVSDRLGEDSRGVVGVTITVDLSVTDLASKKRIWSDNACESMAHHTLNAQNQYEQLMKKMATSENLDRLVERGACLLLCTLGPKGLPPVLDVFRQRRDSLNLAFIEKFVAADPDPVVALAVLVPALKSSERAVHDAALSAILKMKLESKEAIPILAELLDHEDGTLRARAFENLAKIGPPAAAALVDALGNDKSEVVNQSAAVLQRLGPDCPEIKAQVPHLVEACGKSRGMNRRVTMQVLAVVAPEAGMKAFADALMDEDPRVAEQAVKCLEPLGARTKAVLPELKLALTGPNRSTRFDMLALLKSIGAEACDVVALALTDTGPKVRVRAAYILAEMGPRGIEALAPFVDHEDPDLRRIVRGVIAKNAKKEGATAPGKTAPEKTAPEKTAPEKQETVKAPETKPATKPAEEKKKEPPKIVTMKDGKKITAEKVMDFGDAYSVKTTSGKFMTIPKADVEKVENAEGE